MFGHQYAVEMKLPEGQRSTEWVARLPSVLAALNNEVTRMTGKRPSEAVKLQRVTSKPSSVVPGRAIGLEETLIPSDAQVRYLYSSSPGEHELEGGRRRATDPVWSLPVLTVRNVVRQHDQPALYYLVDGPARGFVREELMSVPHDTELPPDQIFKGSKISLR